VDGADELGYDIRRALETRLGEPRSLGHGQVVNIAGPSDSAIALSAEFREALPSGGKDAPACFPGGRLPE
jgi:hypothetical protein